MKPNQLLLFAAAALALPAAASCQFGVYGTFSVDRLSGLTSSPLVTTGTARSDVNPLGGTGGVYYDLRTYGPFRIGADLRGSSLHDRSSGIQGSQGAGSRVDSVLGGVRASFRTPINILHPYLQASAGLGRSDFGLVRDSVGRTQLVSSFEYEAFAGLDLALLPAMDLRIFELGYGGLDPFGTNSHNYPLKSVSVGVVFHLPRSPQ